MASRRSTSAARAVRSRRRSPRSSTAARTCGGLLEVRHDLDALATVTPEAWRTLFAERYGEFRAPVRLGDLGQEGVGLPRSCRTRTSSRSARARAAAAAAAAGARSWGSPRSTSSSAASRATGSFKDLGMTVLVSAVKRMRARGQADPRDRLRLDRRHLRRALGLLRRGGDPLGGVPPQGQGLARAAGAADLRTARWCSRSTPTSTAACGSSQEVTADRSLYLANSMNSLRLEGQKIVAIELCQQLGWELPDWVVDPRREPRQRERARAWAFSSCSSWGSSRRRPRIAVAQAQKANPLYRAFEQRSFARSSPSPRGKTLASAIQIGRPGLVPPGDQGARGVRRGRRGGDRGRARGRRGARGSRGGLQLPADRRRAGGAAQAGRRRGRSRRAAGWR